MQVGDQQERVSEKRVAVKAQPLLGNGLRAGIAGGLSRRKWIPLRTNIGILSLFPVAAERQRCGYVPRVFEL